jgi:hypothetical protein
MQALPQPPSRSTMRESMPLTIELVESAAQLEEFITLPRRLYAGMKGYTPPLDIEQHELLDPKQSPFFSHGVAAYWIARSKGEAVGRVSAQIDQLKGPKDPPSLGMFGCLAATDNNEVIERLLATAEDWLKARDCRRVRGPFVLNVHGEAGMLLEGHNERPMILFPWHPPYLEARLRAAGYERVKRLLCLTLDLRTFPIENLRKIGSARERGHLSIRDMQRSNIDSDMRAVLKMFNDAWHDNWGFAPACEADANAMVKSLKPFLLDDGGFFVDTRGEPGAFALTIPNVYEISADLGPAPSWFGWLKLAFRIWRKRYKSFQVVMLGVVSKFQDSMSGSRLALTAVTEAIIRLHKRGAEEIATGWVLEDNSGMLKILRSIGFRENRIYGVYEKMLEAT